LPGAALHGAADLLGELPADPAPDRREHLVPDRHDDPVDRPVLHRALLRSRRGARAARDPPAAHPPLSVPPTRDGAMSDAMVKAEAVHKSFGRLEVLKGISLEVQPREVMCILGPSGSGKSTFLRCINHLEKINRGRLWVDGELVGYRQSGDKIYELRDSEVARKRSEIGMVFQSFNLFPHMTAIENVVEAPTRVKRVPRPAAMQQELE